MRIQTKDEYRQLVERCTKVRALTLGPYDVVNDRHAPEFAVQEMSKRIVKELPAHLEWLLALEEEPKLLKEVQVGEEYLRFAREMAGTEECLTEHELLDIRWAILQCFLKTVADVEVAVARRLILS